MANCRGWGSHGSHRCARIERGSSSGPLATSSVSAPCVDRAPECTSLKGLEFAVLEALLGDTEVDELEV